MQRNLVLETVKKIGKKVKVCGWVKKRRDHGKLVFIDLRDRSGVVQVVLTHSFITSEVSADFTSEVSPGMNEIRPEDVVEVVGLVKKRPKEMINPSLPTGEIEIEVKKIKVLASAKTPPFPLETDGYKIEEELRLEYRYLDLRRPRMVKNLKLRHQVIKFIRSFLDQKGFIEIETPILTKATPEGARDFLVPSRLQKGKFYALPQSPQQYKQLLMVAGLERYFQIARCFRDEDPRADRAYGEFTQLDLEMSFVSQKEILKLTEELFIGLIQKNFPQKKITQIPFPVLSYQEVIKKYRTDKPDLRKNKKDKDELSFCFIVDFPLFEWKENEQRWDSMHHPFTAPKEEDLPFLEKGEIGKVRSYQHDFVLNGFEIGGGSIRITDPDLQTKIFEILGHTKKEIENKFGHLLKAFQYGVPPHGGIAPGIDRFLMAILNEPSIRETIAFPSTAGGRTSVMEAPTTVDSKQLAELHIRVAGKKLNPKGVKVFEKITSLLGKNKIKFATFEHESVFTSEQAASVRGTKLAQGAKALVAFADKKPVMLVLSAVTKVNNRAYKRLYKVKDLRLASAEEVEEVTGLKIGAVPPFGNLFNLPVFVDKKLGENKEIAFNAGLHERSIKMAYQDFVKLAKPRIGTFAQSF